MLAVSGFARCQPLATDAKEVSGGEAGAAPAIISARVFRVESRMRLHIDARSREAHGGDKVGTASAQLTKAQIAKR